VGLLAARLDQANAAINVRDMAITKLVAKLNQARAVTQQLAAAASAGPAAAGAGPPPAAAAASRAACEGEDGGGGGGGGGDPTSRALQLLLAQANGAMAERTRVRAWRAMFGGLERAKC